MDLSTEVPPLFALEDESMVASTANRRHEFAVGRACARQALNDLGLESVAIPMGRDRAPEWPTAAVGSITHAGLRCFAAVGLAKNFYGIGIDIEMVQPLPAGVLEMICTPLEREWVDAQGADHQWGTLLFAAKECVYKIWYPIVGRWLDFKDVTVTVDRDSHEFEIEFISASDRRSIGTLPIGRFACQNGMVHSALALSRFPTKGPIRGASGHLEPDIRSKLHGFGVG